MIQIKPAGDVEGFDRNWTRRKEAAYNHWCKGLPKNQVQLAFKCHWEVFNEVIGPLSLKKGSVLEVGCGRGSLSSHFAESGWDATLLDHSQNVIKTAFKIFSANGHSANFVTGDANALPFSDECFDITVSIGLLEHFKEVRQLFVEQTRVLRPGGWFLGYVVPERPDNVQRYFNWINRALKSCAEIFPGGRRLRPAKADVFRCDGLSVDYIAAIDDLKYKKLRVFGMYSMPMISHSPEFPFSLLPAPLEWILTRIFEIALATRRFANGRHGWICSENFGQAFLIAFQKSLE